VFWIGLIGGVVIGGAVGWALCARRLRAQIIATVSQHAPALGRKAAEEARR
jgi:hypothetical protein